MPKVSFRMASASRESVFGVQTNTARKIHRSDHTEGRLTTAPSGCCVRKGTSYENVAGQGVTARGSVGRPRPERIPSHVRHAAHVSRLRSGHEAREQKRNKPWPTGPH